MQETNTAETTPLSSTVALVRCEDYDEARVFEAVGRGLALLGGADRFAAPGDRILLKPNMLAALAPDKAVTTHPAVFRAVARHLMERGVHLAYGDSPGYSRPESVARKAGLAAAAEDLGIPMADFSAGDTVSFPGGRMMKQFTLAKALNECDGLISLPKMKTHALTRMTGAVKNQFGCVPGFLKGEFHARLSDMDRFAQMLVDLTRLVRPRLFIMDGILAMEGNGPRNGEPRPMHALLFSTDPVALDAVVCRMMALDPALVPTNKWGQKNGLGTFEQVELSGDPVAEFVREDYVVNRMTGSTTGSLNSLLARVLRNRVVPRPVITASQCTHCGTCVNVCPVAPKVVDFRNGKDQPPDYEYRRCIRCYCCQEMCPEKAIQVHTPLLGRLLHG